MAQKEHNNLTSVILQVPQQLKKDFRAVCCEQDVTMSQGIRLFMRSAVKGRFVINGDLKIRRGRIEN